MLTASGAQKLRRAERELLSAVDYDIVQCNASSACCLSYACHVLRSRFVLCAAFVQRVQHVACALLTLVYTDAPALTQCCTNAELACCLVCLADEFLARDVQSGAAAREPLGVCSFGKLCSCAF